MALMMNNSLLNQSAVLKSQSILPTVYTYERQTPHQWCPEQWHKRNIGREGATVLHGGKLKYEVPYDIPHVN